MNTRYAIVRNARDRDQAANYLPGNYDVIGELYEQKNEWCVVVPSGKIPVGEPTVVFIVAGEDDHGWTLDGYVIPRYASGLIWAEEVQADHPAVVEAMKDGSP